MKTITLTHHNGQPILLNLAIFEHATVDTQSGNTVINLTNGGFLYVKESVAAIENRIKEAYK